MFFMHTNEMVLHRLHKISKRGNKQPKVLTLGKVSPIVKYRPWDFTYFWCRWEMMGLLGITNCCMHICRQIQSVSSAQCQWFKKGLGRGEKVKNTWFIIAQNHIGYVIMWSLRALEGSYAWCIKTTRRRNVFSMKLILDVWVLSPGNKKG